MVEYHIPVLVDKVVEALDAGNAETIVDATLGDAGYFLKIIEKMPGTGKVIGFDRDTEAINRVEARLGSLINRLMIVQDNFRNIGPALDMLDVGKVDGVVADLGVSRLQISDPERGFMYMASGPLKMTMNPDAGLDAEQVVNTFELRDLTRIFREFGEEREAFRIAKAIVRQREGKVIRTTDELRNVIQRVVGRKYEIKSFARIFQAIRIYVNDELASLNEFLPAATDALKSGGRLVIVSYHSLEDRIVKQFIRKQADPCECPKELPHCVCGKRPVLKPIGKLLKADDAEIRLNPSARSARLRIAEKM